MVSWPIVTVQGRSASCGGSLAHARECALVAAPRRGSGARRGDRRGARRTRNRTLCDRRRDRLRRRARWRVATAKRRRSAASSITRSTRRSACSASLRTRRRRRAVVAAAAGRGCVCAVRRSIRRVSQGDRCARVGSGAGTASRTTWRSPCRSCATRSAGRGRAQRWCGGSPPRWSPRHSPRWPTARSRCGACVSPDRRARGSRGAGTPGRSPR